MRTITGNDYLTVGELAKVLNIKDCTLKAWVRLGRFPKANHQIGQRMFYHRREIPELKKKAGLD